MLTPTFPTLTIPTLTFPTFPTFPTLTFPTLTFPTLTVPTFPTLTFPTLPTPTLTFPTFPTPTPTVPTVIQTVRPGDLITAQYMNQLAGLVQQLFQLITNGDVQQQQLLARIQQLEQRVAALEQQPPTSPTVTIPTTFPTFTFPTSPTLTVTFPTGTFPTGTFPTGTFPTGTFPTLTVTFPTGGLPAGSLPSMTIPINIPGVGPTFGIVSMMNQPTFAPGMPVGGGTLTGRTPMEVAGIGARENATLAAAGVGDLSVLAVAEPSALASVLNVDEETALGFVNEARELTGLAPFSPPATSTEPAAGEALSLREVSGIGRVRASRLADADIGDAAALAEASVERVAAALDVSDDRARTFITNARTLLRS